MMDIDLYSLPKKTRRVLDELHEILENAEDKMYCIGKVDYNNGLIRFDSIQDESIKINLYSSTLTLTVEIDGEQFHFKNLSTKQIIDKFNNPLTK